MCRSLSITLGTFLLSLSLWSTTTAAITDACAPVPIQRLVLEGAAFDDWLASSASELDAAARTAAPEHAGELLAVLDGAGFEPQALRDWVARHTAYIPYSGVLRGARGVLMERRGNSMDRALLLGRLLEAAGYDARLARGPRVVVPSAAPGTVMALPEVNTQVLDTLPIPPGHEAALEVAAQRAEQCDAAMRARIAEQTGVLLKLVGTATAAPPAAQEDAYWWVQVDPGSGWSDLFIDDLGGQAPAADATHPLDQLPEALFHHVSFRFVAELWNGRRANRQVLLEHRARAADLVGRDIWLLQHPQPTTELANAIAAPGEHPLLTALESAPVWTPRIRIGDRSYTDRAVSLDGRSAPATVTGLASLGSADSGSAAALGGTGGGLLSGAFGGGARGGKAPAGALLAEWLEIETGAPGSETRLQRRTLLDTLAGQRPARGRVTAKQVKAASLDGRGLALLTDIQAASIATAPSPAYLTRETLREAAQALNTIRAAANDQPPTPAQDRALGQHTALLDYARRRLALGSDGVYAARPNLILLRTAATRGPDGELRVTRIADLVDNSVTTVDTDSFTASFAARLRQGVTDTVLETRLLGDTAPGGLNTAERMAQSTTAWLLIAPDQRDQLAQLEPPAALATQMNAALDSGYLLVVPPRLADDPVYWRIDPRTGDTLGIGPDGIGGMLEDAELRAMANDLKFAFTELARYEFVFFGCLAARAAGVVSTDKQMLTCIGAGLAFAWGGHAVAISAPKTAALRAGYVVKYAGLGTLAALGITDYRFKKWIKGLFKQ